MDINTQAEFNVAVLNAVHADKLRKEIGQKMASGEFKMAGTVLILLNSEIKGYWTKRKKLEEFADIQDCKEKFDQLRLSQSANPLHMLKLIEDWYEKAVAHCYKIGWFDKMVDKATNALSQ